jgi:hypothetical protein
MNLESENVLLCDFCGARLGAVQYVSGHKRFCGDTDCMANYQDGKPKPTPQLVVLPKPKPDKLNWRFHPA